MGRKGSNLTRLSATHVEAFEQLLPPELKATLADLIATSPEMKKWSDRGAKKDAWMALKKVAADACTEIEIDYFRARSGSPLIVMPDMRIQPPDRADIVKRAAAKAGTTEESAATAVAFGDKTGFVPLPPTIEDSHGRTVAHPRTETRCRGGTNTTSPTLFRSERPSAPRRCGIHAPQPIQSSDGS